MVVANKNQIMAGKVLAKSFPVIFGALLNLPIVVVSSYFEQFEVINYWWLAHWPIAVAQSWSALNTQYSEKAKMAFIIAEVEYIFSTAGALVVIAV